MAYCAHNFNLLVAKFCTNINCFAQNLFKCPEWMCLGQITSKQVLTTEYKRHKIVAFRGFVKIQSLIHTIDGNVTVTQKIGTNWCSLLWWVSWKSQKWSKRRAPYFNRCRGTPKKGPNWRTILWIQIVGLQFLRATTFFRSVFLDLFTGPFRTCFKF